MGFRSSLPVEMQLSGAGIHGHHGTLGGWLLRLTPGEPGGGNARNRKGRGKQEEAAGWAGALFQISIWVEGQDEKDRSGGIQLKAMV